MLPSLYGPHTDVLNAIRYALLWFCLSVQAPCSMSAQALPGIPDHSRGAWMALLHYWGDEGKWLSEVKDTSFFLDVEGPRNPESEWGANIRAFLAPVVEGRSEQHAQCRFPARFALMKEALGWSDGDVRQVDCPEVAAHQRKLRAKSLSVVFATHYLNNPASTFGHTMLYLGSDSNAAVMLADYSVSFEAEIGGMSPLAYLPRGLFGRLVAGYRVIPFHERVRKYEREEQRDLWLFPLKVSQGEIDQLVRHLWELKDVTFKYGFFAGNCAQKILAVVHAVAPGYEVLPYHSPAVLPSEVARRLVEQIGLAGEPVRRRSQWSQYTRRVAELAPQEKQQFKEMVASRTVFEDASPATLSAALLWSEIETPHRAFRRAAETDTHADFVWTRALWASRVAIDGATGERFSRPVEEPGPSLLQGHRPTRVKLRGGYRSGRGSVVGVEARWLLHEAVDPQVGYPLFSSMEAGRVDFGVSGAGGLFVDEATAIRIERLAPVSPLQSSLAWKIDIGARRLAHDGESPLHIGAEVGFGRGAALLRPGYLVAVYGMFGARPGAMLGRSETSFLTAGILSGGLILRLPMDFRARVSGEYSFSLFSLEGGAATLNAVTRKGLTRGVDLELAATRSPKRSGLTLGFVSFR